MSSINNSVFVAAQDAFRATLSAKDQADYTTCDSPADLLSSLERLLTSTKQIQTSRLNRCVNVVSKLNSRLQSYFDALNVVFSVDDTAALAYGALRIVLQLASALPSFLDKLLAAIVRLTEKFPQYEKIIELFDGKPPLYILNHFEKVYQGFFEFLQLAAKILNASNGRVRRPVEMLARVVWTPFDARFGEILVEMERNRLFVYEEMEIMTARHAKNVEREAILERERAEGERIRAEKSRKNAEATEAVTREMRETQLNQERDLSYRQIRDWLTIPPQFAQALLDSRRQRIDGTSQWLFYETAFIHWIDSDVRLDQTFHAGALPPWVLWVSGKFALEMILCQQQLTLTEEGNSANSATCYFFFDYNNPRQSTIGALYSAVLAQILHSKRDDTEILDKFLFIQSDSASSFGQPSATEEQLFDLICVCANTFGPITLVIDGIDEAKHPNTVSESLHTLTRLAPVKLVYFSRPNINYLQEKVPEQNRVTFTRSTIDPDIRSFLDHKLQEMIDRRKLPTGTDVCELSETLLRGADGMFLWAKLMIKYLESPVWSPSARVAKIRSVNFPEDLDDMYDRILSLIMASPRHEMELAKRIVIWIQHSSHPNGIELKWLWTAIGNHNDTDEVDNHDPYEFDNFASVAIAVCGGLVEYSTKYGFRFIHLTVNEYFDDVSTVSGSKKAASFLDKTTAVSEITSRCIEYLLSQAPDQMPLAISPRDTFASGETMLNFHRSFEAYAAAHWWRHLTTIPSKKFFGTDINDEATSPEARSIMKVQTALHRFFKDPLAVGLWIEDIYSLLTPVRTIVDLIKLWIQHELLRSPVKLTGQLRKLATDLDNIENNWGGTLSEKPYLIWNDVMLFTKLETFPDLNTSAAGKFTSLAPIVESARHGEPETLCSISSTSSDGQTVGVLSIVPSMHFTQFWRRATRLGAYDEGEQFCHGWFAQYELWSVDPSTRLASINIPLSQHEIAILFRQSFRQIGHDCQSEYVPFETSFPMSIGHDCLRICVLRTVYRILPDETEQSATFESCLLPLERLRHFDVKFGPELQKFSPETYGRLPQIFHVEWRDWYNYSTFFSPDGRYIAFADYQMPCLTNLVVFKIHLTHTLNLEFVQSAEARIGSPRVSKVVFHNQQPLLAFLAESKAWLWPFEGSINAEIVPVETRFNACDTTEYSGHGPCYVHQRPIEDCKLEYLSFSACGQYVLVRTTKETEVVRVPENCLFTNTTTYGTIKKRKVGRMTFAENDYTPGPHSQLMNKQEIPGRFLSQNKLLVEGQVLSMGSIVSSEMGYNIDISQEEAPNASVHLLALPNSMRNKGLALGIKIPQKSDDFLTMVLNKSSAEGYTLNRAQDFVHPSIVKKNLRLLGGISSITTRAQDTETLEPPTKRSKSQKSSLPMIIDTIDEFNELTESDDELFLLLE